MGTLGDKELAGDVAGFLLDGADLVHQDDGVDDHAVSDDVDRVFAENTGRDRVKHESVAAEDQRMPCVRASLESCNDFVIRS